MSDSDKQKIISALRLINGKKENVEKIAESVDKFFEDLHNCILRLLAVLKVFKAYAVNQMHVSRVQLPEYIKITCCAEFI